MREKVNTAKMKGEENKNYWSDCGEVFFTGGMAYGLDVNLRIISLDKEDIIAQALKTNTVPKGLNPIQREALEWVINYRKENGFGEQIEQTNLIAPRSPVGSRPLRVPQHREAHPRQSAPKQRLPLRKVGQKNQSVSGK